MIYQSIQSIRIAMIAMFVSLVGISATVQADDYAKEWAPPVGSAMPAIAAKDHTGADRNFENLAGENGILIFLNRSADW